MVLFYYRCVCLRKDSVDTKDAPKLHTIWDEFRRHIESGNYDKSVEIYRYVLVRYGDNGVAACAAPKKLRQGFL